MLAGITLALWRRLRDRGALALQEFSADFLPLILLFAVSVTGLALTFSAALLRGSFYEFLAILHAATSGIHWTTDAGTTWTRLDVPGTSYYPQALERPDGEIMIFGHIGGDDAYGSVDQSVVMDRFRLERR